MAAVVSAVESARVAPPSWRSGVACDGGGDAIEQQPARKTLVDAPAFDAADDPEALILARCGAQIAGEAGPGAVVHAIGARRQAALLAAAVAALPEPPGARPGVGRRIVYLPRTVARRRNADALLALLRDVTACHGDDALLVVAIETTSSREDARLDRLARVAGWEPCQRWTDGFARHAVHVLERSARAVPVRAS